MESNQLDLDFAKAWDNNQGSFSSQVAKNIINFSQVQDHPIKTALDICCGTSNFLRVLNDNGIECSGTEIDQSMIDYSSQKYPNMKYYLSKDIYELPVKGKFNLITCNHDMINYMENFDEWKMLFKNVEKHLDKNGIFVFDFYTKNKLKNWSETSFTSSNWLDCLMTVKSGIYDKTVLTYTYYINYQDYMIKTKNIVVECYYENKDIMEALNKAGFRNVMFVDENFNPVENAETMDRIHVIAMRK